MLNLDPEFSERGICPGCTRQVFAYKNNAVRWNGELWHNRCALRKMYSLLTPVAADLALPNQDVICYVHSTWRVNCKCPAPSR